MKILYIANARIPTEKAHGIQIMKMCEALGMGNDLELVIPRRINWIKKNAFEYYGIEKNFKIKKFPCIDLIPFDKLLGHLALWIESFTFFAFSFFYIIFKKTDIIYTRDKFFLGLAFFKNNLVFEAHTFPKNYFLYSWFFKRTKAVISITKQLKNLFVEKGVRPEKIFVSADGVDLKQFNIKESKEGCREKINLPLDEKILLYTGHLYKWKGADVLVQASKFLKNNIAVYFVGGTKKHVREFKEKYSDLDINIVGHKPYSQMALWLKSADLLVLPNSAKQKISHWTSPIKMFEYMASKRPIIASDIPSIREILNENNAFLVKPDNPRKLAEAIANALETPVFSDKISNQAFQDVQAYTWQKRAENILKFIS